MNKEIRLLKLTNGEDVIANVDTTNPKLYHLYNPLVMKMHSKLTSNGVQEGLHLSRWVAPFTEERSFSIEKKHIVLDTEVSIGLSRYYEYSIKSFERDEDRVKLPKPEPTAKELAEIELEEACQEGEEEFLALESPSNKIH